MIMEKEFIPYEKALALKELGFDEPCFGYYDGNHNLQFMYNSIPEKFTEKRMGVSNSTWVGWISAPLYQQAFRWFREEYNFDYYIRPNIVIDIPKTYQFNIDDNTDDNWYKTYLEAELECLKKVIEFIKQFKKK